MHWACAVGLQTPSAAKNMAPSVSKEELMRNTDSVIWGFNGSAGSDSDESQRICEKIWNALNGRVCNAVVVIFVFAEGFVVLSELLIDLNVVQDPEWKLKNANCSHNTSVLPSENVSPKLKQAKEIFSYFSIVLLTIFIIEVILRIVTGKTRFIVQGIEVFDAIIVLVAFGLDATFFIAPWKNSTEKDAAVLIILLRLWRISKIINNIIDSAKAKLGIIINTYQREKIQSEHKVDLLILKVEDLEHEVAYLKEKLKKAEKEPLFVKRRKNKDGTNCCVQKPTAITIAIEPNSSSLPLTQSHVFNSDEDYFAFQSEFKGKIGTYAEKYATIIIDEALLLASHLWYAGSCIVKMKRSSPSKTKFGSKLKRRPEGSIESGYGSAASSINWNKVRVNLRTEEKNLAPTNAIVGNQKCPESSPESGYGSGGSAHNPHNNESSPQNIKTELTGTSTNESSKPAGMVFLFPDSSLPNPSPEVSVVELEVLDEVSEIERIKHVEFDPNRYDKGVPMTSL